MRVGCVSDGGTWLSYTEAAKQLGISREAVRRRADRGHWARAKANEDRTVRILVPESLVLDASSTPAQDASGTRAAPVQDDAPALVRALEAHIETLKADVERLTVELAGERAARQGDQERVAGQLVQRDKQLAAAQARADQAAVELVGERAARRVGQELADMREADQAAQLAQRDEQLVAAQARANQATAELIALAQRLAAIAEAQAVTEVAPEPLQRSALGRAWGWWRRRLSRTVDPKGGPPSHFSQYKPTTGEDSNSAGTPHPPPATLTRRPVALARR
jgi:hypothetical protein